MQKMRIQIVGFGCPKCNTLAKNAELAAKELGLEYEIKMCLKPNDIISFGFAMLSPALIINDRIKITGKVASVKEIKQLILETELVKG